MALQKCLAPQKFSHREQKLIKTEARKAEEKRQWTTTLLELAGHKKLFHLLVPEALGGCQLPLPEALRWFEEASYLDGSFGWTLTLGAGAGMFSAYMETGFAEDIFSDKKAFVAGSGFPAGKAIPIEGGYKVTGSWKYISGWPHATLFTTNCVIVNEQEKKQIKAFSLTPEQVEILKTWNSYGLKATSSDNIRVTGQFVPHERTFVVAPETSRFDAALYRFPFEPFAQCTLACSLLGIAERFYDEASRILHKEISAINGTEKATETILKKTFIKINRAKESLFKKVAESWKPYMDRKEANSTHLNEIKTLSSKLNRVVLESASLIYPHLGMDVLDETTSVNRSWRDLHTASQHTFLTPKIEMNTDEEV